MPPTPPTLHDLLAAGNALLKPPDPLPSSPPELLSRLRQSSQLVPWRDRPGWGEDDELDEIGDSSSSGDAADALRTKARRDHLVLIVGQRCLDLLVAMQAWLGKEFWPVDQRDGLDAKDFLLGTADLRLVRLLLAHAVSSYLLPLTLTYVAGLSRRQPPDPRLPAALSSLLELVQTPQPPAAPSARGPTPPTTISQTLVSSHLASIALATVVVALTPTVPPAVYASLRAQLAQALAELSPKQGMASLATALKIVQASKGKTPRGWTRPWPGYVEGALGTLMSGQVQRPGGVRAVMENVFGEAGNMSGPEAVDNAKLDQVAGLLSRVPRNISPDVYIPHLLSVLFDLIAPESTSHPIVYTHAASYVVYHLWSTSPIAADWLKTKLQSLWLPVDPHPGVVASAEAVETAVTTMTQLITHSPPSAAFVDFIVRPILPPLFSLYATLSPKLQAKSIEKAAEAAPGLADNVKLLLTSWAKVVPKNDGVQGIWAIITGGKGWPASEGRQLHWVRKGLGAELVYDYDESMPEPAIATAMDVDDDAMLDQFDLSPDPAVLSGLLKDIDRPELSGDVFLKVLDEWRVRSTADDQDPLQSLLFLRLTISMMEDLGDKLLSKPEHVLSFVEGVLNDEVQNLSQQKGPLIEEVETKGPLIEEIDEPMPELTSEGIEKMGMVETAISLLLASLEANEKLNHATAAILHPISSHLETLSESGPPSVRQLAREALLVLLVRRSASLTADEKQVSPAVATYRRALALIADPILPVRAHGLILLRDLVHSKDYDPALTPSILDVYMSAIQDQDSYIYLNAVKGLAAMADALGKDIFRTLVRLYREGDDYTGDKLDKALRIGEALGMVITRAGKAFSANAEIVVPTLLTTFPNERLPTIMRTSALSLLTTCAEVDHLALLPWSDELASAAVDLVQIESVASSPFRPAAAEPTPAPAPPPARRKVVLIDDEMDEDQDEDAPGPPAQPTGPRIVDAEPTAQDSKHPALRRAAVVFLGILAASLIETAQGETHPSDEFTLRLPSAATTHTRPSTASQTRPANSNASPSLDARTLARADTVLRYVAATDDDEVVRGQAGEVVALVERLRTLRAVEGVGRNVLL